MDNRKPILVENNFSPLVIPYIQNEQHTRSSIQHGFLPINEDNIIHLWRPPNILISYYTRSRLQSVRKLVRSFIHPPSLSSSYKWVYASLRTCFYFLFVVAPIVVVVVLLFPYTQYERSEYIKWGINLHRNFYYLNGIVASLFQHVVDSDKLFASSISPKWRFHFQKFSFITMFSQKLTSLSVCEVFWSSSLTTESCKDETNNY